jgi:hypothetical protein
MALVRNVLKIYPFQVAKARLEDAREANDGPVVPKIFLSTGTFACEQRSI